MIDWDNYIEAPRISKPNIPSVFLAGSITGTDDWQDPTATKILNNGIDLQVFNPRRKNFPIDDPAAAFPQIVWEQEHLRKAHAILFWFAAETVAPIVLYELGTWTTGIKPIFIGIDPDYPRRLDVIYQTLLRRPDIIIHNNLDDLSWAVIQHFTPPSTN